MLTQCPGCQTVFRVTSTILRAAHGQVRCGRCNTQFDAIERLLDGDDPPADTAVTSTSLQVEQDIPHEDIVLEGNRIEISGVYRRVDDDVAAADADTEHTHTVIEEFNIGTEEWENPFDKDSADDDATETEVEDVEQELNAASLADALAELDISALAERDADSNESTNAPATFPSIKTAPLPNSTKTRTIPPWPPLVLDSNDEPFVEPAPAKRWPWAVASTLLALLLIGQTLHHFRETLARHQSFGPQLSKLYAALGQPLAPQWQLQAYSIKQWGIVSDPQAADTLRVRASVTNGARFAQPYPLLQLSLEDRFGSQVGTREFKPEEYLASNTQATRLLAAGESANVDLAIIDPGADAVGFQFDSCLLLNNRLQCSHDAALKQP